MESHRAVCSAGFRQVDGRCCNRPLIDPLRVGERILRGGTGAAFEHGLPHEELAEVRAAELLVLFGEAVGAG